MLFILCRRLRPQDGPWLQREEKPQLVALGQALLSDFSALPASSTVIALQEEVKETGLVPQFEGEVSLKSGSELMDLLLESELVHL
jgi:hypothetical protein